MDATAKELLSGDREPTWEGWAAVDTMNSVFRKTPPADSGLGWVMADAAHNVPASGPFDPRIDYRSQYRKAWGLS